MRIHIHKTDLAGVEAQLTRIADLLEGILGATNQLPMPNILVEHNIQRVEYSDDKKDIVDYHIRRMGREPK